MDYLHTLDVGFDPDCDLSDLEVTVAYTVSWGTPETGRGYMADPDKYDPGSPDIVEGIRIVRVEDGTVLDAALSTKLVSLFEGSDGLQEELLWWAREVEGAYADQARED